MAPEDQKKCITLQATHHVPTMYLNTGMSQCEVNISIISILVTEARHSLPADDTEVVYLLTTGINSTDEKYVGKCSDLRRDPVKSEFILCQSFG